MAEKIKQVREDLARELRVFSRIVKENEICRDARPLEDAVGQCWSGTGVQSADEWGYSLNRLIFRPSAGPRPVPRELADGDLALALSVIVSAKLPDSDTASDPFRHLEFNLVLRGDYVKEIAGEVEERQVFWSWHFDRHITSPGNQSVDEPEYIHPLYHFQHGGKELWSAVDKGQCEFSDCAVLETPRIAHPPMDAILGIDFVLTNYYPKQALGFRSGSEYQAILRKAQLRCWKPYVQSLWSAWGVTESKCSLDAKDLWPQLSDARGEGYAIANMSMPPARRRGRSGSRR